VAADSVYARATQRGIQLANGQWKGTMSALGITLDPPQFYDDARPDGTGYDALQERYNVSRCLADPHAIAYEGALSSAAAAVAEPILNRAGMLMVSGADTSPSLTNPALRRTHEPATFYHRRPTVTFFRTITTDSLQGPAGATFVKSHMHARTYFLVDDRQPYGMALALRFRTYARRTLHLTETGRGHINAATPANIAESADAMVAQVLAHHPQVLYYAGDPAVGGALLERLRARGFDGPFLGAVAHYDHAFITNNSPAETNSFATYVGPDPRASSQSFVAAYHQAFKGKAIGPYDATSYDATCATLTALYAEAKAGLLKGSIEFMRSHLAAFMARVSFDGATGPISFDANGDIRNKVVSTYAIEGNSWKYMGVVPGMSKVSPTS
jgi:branched-chain amino acid transport system substrate-binding protein